MSLKYKLISHLEFTQLQKHTIIISGADSVGHWPSMGTPFLGSCFCWGQVKDLDKSRLGQGLGLWRITQNKARNKRKPDPFHAKEYILKPWKFCCKLENGRGEDRNLGVKS